MMHPLRLAYDAGRPGAEAAIRDELNRHRFYHCIDVVPGIETPGIQGNRIYTDNFRAASGTVDFRGKRVIDIGCRDGAQLFIAEESGAAELVGVDNDLSSGLTEFLIPFRGSKVQAAQANLYDLTPETFGTFDIAIAAGLLYHLRYPGWGLKKLADLLDEGGVLILETAILDAFDDLPVVFYPIGEASPYEPTSPTFCNLPGLRNMLAMAGFGEPTVRARFFPIKFSAAKHFPAFYEKRGDDARMTITRTILTVPKTCARNRLDAYFEGTHGYHSKGAA